MKSFPPTSQVLTDGLPDEQVPARDSGAGTPTEALECPWDVFPPLRPVLCLLLWA